jgi:hypothetical protein
MDQDTKHLVIGVFIVAAIAFGVVVLLLKMLGSEDPEWSIGFVSGTEYRWGETGQIIVEVRDRNGNPVQSGCNASIYYPNKTAYISNYSMVSSGASGNSYMSFTVPNVTGIFEYQAKCVAMGRLQVASKSFHVNVRDIRGWVTP